MAVLHQRLYCDVLVAGGGMAGVCAAVAAARHGAKVVLVQDRPVLGGNASSEIRMHVLGADRAGLRPYARESGLLEEILLEDAVRNPQRSATLFDLLLWEKVTDEDNIHLLLNTQVDGAEMATSSRISGIRATRHSTEETFSVAAKLFVDCTGDGRLGAEAGAEFRVGREGRDEYGETFAPQGADNRVLGSSILFMASRHESPMPFNAPHWARHFTEDDLKLRPHAVLEYG